MLEVRLLESSESRPILVTAGHVLEDPDEGLMRDCEYQPAVSNGVTYPLVATASAKSSEQRDSSIIPSTMDKFSQDWAVASLGSRPGWKGHSIPFLLTESAGVSGREEGIERAFLVGYDVGGNRFMIDSDCEYGRLDNESIFGDSEVLVWDDCDSVQGSSGGVLFALDNGTPRITGIRVGNVFDAGAHPDGPGPGEEFDINANINLTRLIDQDVVLAMRALLETNYQ